MKISLLNVVRNYAEDIAGCLLPFCILLLFNLFFKVYSSELKTMLICSS